MQLFLIFQLNVRMPLWTALSPSRMDPFRTGIYLPIYLSDYLFIYLCIFQVSTILISTYF